MRSPRLLPALSPNQVLWLVCAGVFFASLDQTVVVTALPALMVDLEIGVTRLNDVAWVVTGYLLGFTAVVPLLARVGDVYGHRRVYGLGLVVIAGASVVVALAPSLGWVIGARVVQAFGGGSLIAAAIALASDGLPASRRFVVLGIVGASAEMGSVLGPLYGGLIIDLLDWRWIFWLNVPQSVALLVGLAFVPRSPNQAARVDYAGGVLLAVGLTGVTLALAQRSIYQSESGWPLVVLAVGIGVLIALFVVEARVRDPLLNRSLFLSRRFVAAFSTQLLVGSVLIIGLVTVPLMAEISLGRSSLDGALRLLRLTGAMPVGAVLGGALARRIGPRWVIAVGLAFSAVGFQLMSQWGEGIQDPAMTVHLMTTGFGLGLVIAPILAVAIQVGGTAYRGTAAGLITVARMLGMTLGLAALSGWGIGYFELLTADLAFPFPGLGEGTGSLQAYQADVTNASLAVFSGFFRAGAMLSLAALIPMLWMQMESGEDSKDPSPDRA